MRFHHDGMRPYDRCDRCRLVFVPSDYFLTRTAERSHYDLHENDPSDMRYRVFLSRLADPLLKRLQPGRQGLDFGSGPGPTLSVMLEEAGHHVALYDCFYADEPRVFDRTYEFITASEVVEHLHDPAAELQRLWTCLDPGGILAIMTKLVRDHSAFADWHYIRDPTHVAFYSRETFRWLADRWKAQLTFVDRDVMLFNKPH